MPKPIFFLACILEVLHDAFYSMEDIILLVYVHRGHLPLIELFQLYTSTGTMSSLVNQCLLN